MRHPFFCLAACALLLGGCATYRPAPVDPAATRAQWQARRLDDPALAARLRPWLPARDHGQWPPASYGRAELLLAALALNPDLAEARARRAAAGAAGVTARARANPTLGLALERYTQAQADSEPWLWGLSTDFLLDGGLRRRLRVQLADPGVRGARLDYAEKVWSVRRALRDALAQTLLARRQQDLATRTVTTADAPGVKKQFDGTTWVDGNTGTDIYLGNIAGTTTSLSVSGGSATGAGTIPLTPGEFTYVTIVAK
jgi:outer membrane protein TolC